MGLESSNIRNTGYKMYPFIPICLKSDQDIIIKTLDNSPHIEDICPEYIHNLRQSIKHKIEIVANLNPSNYVNNQIICEMFRNPEKRKQMIAINGSLIRYFVKISN